MRSITFPIVLLLLAFATPPAAAQGFCQYWARDAAVSVQNRDSGESFDQNAAYIRQASNGDQAIIRMRLQMLRDIWGNRRLTADDAAAISYRYCGWPNPALGAKNDSMRGLLAWRDAR